MRCTVKAQPLNRNAPPKLVSNVYRCKIKKKKHQSGKQRRRGVLEKMAHQRLSKKPAITTAHTFGNVPQPFLKTAAKPLTKEIRSVTLHDEQQRETVHTLFFFHFSTNILTSSPFRQSLLAAPDSRSQIHAPSVDLVKFTCSSRPSSREKKKRSLSICRSLPDDC